MNTQIHNTIQDYTDEAEETLSLSNFCMEDDNTVVSEQSFKPNQTSSSSSSSSSLTDEDFLGFFSEEWSRSTSPENVMFCGKVVSYRRPISVDRKQGIKSQTNPLFRSNSDSFRFMSLKSASRTNTSRSKSLPNRSASLVCQSRFMVFMFGSGSAKFSSKMDMSDIKSRQLRRQSSIAGWVNGGKDESGGRRSEKKGWWRLVDVLGCGGGYEREIVEVI